jgi:hypothetical protein
MKRFFALMLALLMLFALVACGDDEQESDDPNGAQTNGDVSDLLDPDGGLIFPGSDIPGGITLPEDTFE